MRLALISGKLFKTNQIISDKKMDISNNQIHVWKLDLKNDEVNLNHLYENVLSPDEKKRVDKLRSKDDKKRYIYSRGLLRKKLGAYLDVDPANIRFSYNKYGKPSLNAEVHTEDLKFNVSHSKDIVIYAITRNREIGIDVEYLKDINRAEKIIEKFFSMEEKNFYNSQPEHKRKWAFFALWTRKEAYSKAMGRGIGLPSKDFELNLIPYNEQSSSDSFKKSKWMLYDVEIESEYLAALATEGNDINIKYCKLDTSA